MTDPTTRDGLFMLAMLVLSGFIALGLIHQHIVEKIAIIERGLRGKSVDDPTQHTDTQDEFAIKLEGRIDGIEQRLVQLEKKS